MLKQFTISLGTFIFSLLIIVIVEKSKHAGEPNLTLNVFSVDIYES